MQIERDDDEIIENLNENELEDYNNNQNKNDNLEDIKGLIDDREIPIQLIDFEGQNFKLNEEALQILSQIEDEIIIVSIVGKARTGKSYLMNLILDNIGKKRGFDVDSTISSCTKGIWLWGTTRKSQSSNAKIIFIDSEGTSSIDRSTKTYDSKIFALVVLISSLFIYNTTANIDEHGISELSLAAHLSSSIASNNPSITDKENMIREMAPNFIWVLRDFTLEKVHPDSGEEISSNEYLEICLRKKISGRNSAENNLIRENIIKYFRIRECITLPRPVESEDELKNLKNIKLENLKPNFKYEFLNLKNKIFKEAKPKIINGKKLNGTTLANLIKEFIFSINNGAVPNINNAWDSVVAQDIKNCFDKSFKFYKDKIKNFSIKDDNLSSYELNEFVFNLKNETLNNFYQFLIQNPEVFSNQIYKNLYEENKLSLENEISKLEEKTLKEDLENKRKINYRFLKIEYKKIVDQMFKNYYNIDRNNLHEIGNDLITILKNYEENSDGTERLKILTNFLNDNMKEMLYYIVSNTKTDNKIKINEAEKKIQMNNLEVKDLEKSGNKLKEINEILDNRVRFLIIFRFLT